MKLNHIGIVVSHIKDKLKFYEKMCSSSVSASPIVPDEIQGVNVCFVDVGKVTFELIEPINKNSPVSNFLKKGGGSIICALRLRI